MLKQWLYTVAVVVACLGVLGCQEDPKTAKIGVSFGVGEATRWRKEAAYMQERARELGLEMEVRLNTTDKPKTQTEDCLEMIANGIDVLILIPRNVRDTEQVLTYARQKNVKVISYARSVMGNEVDLYIGYDCYKIGQTMGQHLTEKVYKGDYIILKGDEGDFNTPLLYYGAMKYLKPLIDNGDIRVLVNEYVPKWSTTTAYEIVKKAVAANGNHVDAILAPNDALAGASAKALADLNITKPVIITGMDAELKALQRILAGTQDATSHLDLRTLARTAVDEALNLALRKQVSTNSTLDNDSTSKINAFLINGKLITRENLDKQIIETGVFTREQVYGE